MKKHEEQVVMTEITLTDGQYKMLCESLRRSTRFHNGEPLTMVWTGLDYASDAKPVTECQPQMMKFDGKYEDRCLGWLKLTEHGAKIVQAWLDAGYTYEDIEGGKRMPPRIISIS